MYSTSRRLGVIGVVAAAIAPPLAARGQPASPDEVVVTGSLVPTPKREIGTAVTVVDAAEIELRGYDGLADLLRTQIGIGVTNTGGAGQPTALRIRGEDGYRTQLIIDGVKALDPSGTQVGPSFDNLLATGDMERVEILRGPQGFIYGADAGGVVNVISSRGAGPFGGRVSVEGGSFGTRRVNGSVAGGSERGDYYVSISDFATDGFNTQTADTVLRDRDGADNTTLHAKLGWAVGKDWRLQLVARAIDATVQYDGCFLPVTYAIVNDCVATTDQKTYRLSADYAGTRTTQSLGLSTIDIARDSLAEGLSAFVTHGQLDRFEYTGSYRPTDAQTLVYGLDLEDERVASDARQQRNQSGYYVEYQGRLGAGVFLTAGARRDDNDDFGSYTSGRLSLAVVRDVGGGTLKYRASYGTGFRAPSLYEIAYDRGPASYPPAAGLALAPEQSRGYDLGIDFDRPSGLHFEATLFDQRITDEIFFDLDTFSGYLQSDGESRSRGLELGARLPLGQRFQLLANLTANETADTANLQRLRRPRRLGNVGVQYDGGNGLRLVVNTRFARDAVDVGRVALPDYRVLDASLAYSLSKAFELFARVENVTDTDYVETIGFNTGGRAAYAGLKIRF